MYVIASENIGIAKKCLKKYEKLSVYTKGQQNFLEISISIIIIVHFIPKNSAGVSRYPIRNPR